MNTFRLGEILRASRILQAPNYPLYHAHALVVAICEQVFPRLDPTAIRICLSTRKAISPYGKNSAWASCDVGDGVALITVLQRYHGNAEALFEGLLHELAHVRQYQLAPGAVPQRTAHRVESWRVACFEAAQACWPGVFTREQFIGSPGRREKRRFDDVIIHGFPTSVRGHVEGAGQQFLPSWARIEE